MDEDDLKNYNELGIIQIFKKTLNKYKKKQIIFNIAD